MINDSFAAANLNCLSWEGKCSMYELKKDEHELIKLRTGF